MTNRCTQRSCRSFAMAVVFLVANAAAFSDAVRSSKTETVIDIGSRRELFVDDFLIEQMSGAVKQHLLQPEPKEVILTTDAPWEGNTSAYFTIFRDGDIYRMYYRGSHWDTAAKKATHREVTCYAESADGIHWTKPNLGLVEFDGSKQNNIVLDGLGTHCFVAFKDGNPNCPPEARYKGIARGRPIGKKGLYVFQSADGIHWSLIKDEPVITEGAFDSQNLALWDGHTGHYREYHRTFVDGKRAIMTGTSEDFVNWTEPVLLEYQANIPAQHLYTNAVQSYERAPHLLIGFPTRYLPAEGQRVEPTLMMSRDGRLFHRWLDPVIPETAPKDRSGNRSNYMAWGLVEIPGRPKHLSVYATEAYYTGPDSRVRRFEYRQDGFVAVRGDAQGGELITKPLRFEGSQLRINFSTSPAGSLRIELQDAAGTPIKGFALADCDPQNGDAIDGIVSWNSTTDVSQLAKTPVRLKFALQDADLYSFRFAPDVPASGQRNETRAGPKLIHAGPMVGHVSNTTASVWIRTKRGTRVTALAVQGDQSHKPTDWHDRGADCHVVSFSGLAAATKTTVTLTATRDGSDPEEVTLNFQTYPAPSQTGEVRIAFGSCSKISQYPSGPIYNAIAEEAPQTMVFLGDNAYFIVADGSNRHFQTTGPVGDWSFPDSMRARHLLTRVHPELQTMFRSVPCYGIWDDHDYGPDNADRTFELQEEALRVFTQMWANPAWGTPETPGIFSSFRCGPAEIFLLDDRYHKYSPKKHRDVTRDTGVIWGDAQLAWLLDKLKKSTAPVKVIANGTQVLCRDGRGEGHYSEARGELEKLRETLVEHKIGGVVFITGDRHHSEAMQEAQPDGTLLVEATSSPLQQDQKVSILDRCHSNQIWGMRGNNYGLLTISIPEPDRGTITFETRDENNQTPIAGGAPCRTTWTLPQLNYGADDRGNVPQTWTPIFNGKDLEGWTQRNGTASYRVAEGNLVGTTAEGSPNSFLCTEATYGDFELTFEVKVDDALNSGVQIRSHSKADFEKGRVHGPQVEIEAAPGAAGYIYSEGTGRGWLSQNRSKTDPFQNGAWNHYYIRAEGDRIRTWINGLDVADLSDTSSSRSGFIGLQVHSIAKDQGPFEVRWRNLYVKPIIHPPSSAR